MPDSSFPHHSLTEVRLTGEVQGGIALDTSQPVARLADRAGIKSRIPLFKLYPDGWFWRICPLELGLVTSKPKPITHNQAFV